MNYDEKKSKDDLYAYRIGRLTLLQLMGSLIILGALMMAGVKLSGF